MRTPIIAANWKMNLGDEDNAINFVRRIRHGLIDIDGIERVLCPPFTSLGAVFEVLRPSPIQLGAQNMHWEESGAYTGEISAQMLSLICRYVILGHSERRATESQNENDAAINRKVHAALKHDLTPILCVGENLAQNEGGETQAFVSGQVQAALNDLTTDQVARCVIAYEPIWAIGTGKAATPSQANGVIGLTIRGTIAELHDEGTAQSVRVLYGGSVNVENIAAFMRMPEIDGALVGGASLKPDFVDLVRNAAGVT
ncbi:MAG: triose-phosphate isomerase [Anaerolineales bacterium]|nr:triose-phosphate isomerase [Anaerolineales bacterium]